MKTQTKSQVATKSKGFFLKKIAICTLLAFASPYAFAAVTDVHCESGDDLHTAITNAAAGDTLNITGTCFANGNTFVIDKNLSLVGKDASAILDGGNTATTAGVPILWVQSGITSTLDNLTIQNGLGNLNPLPGGSPYLGGAVTNEGSLTILKSNIINNQRSASGLAGGILQWGSLASLTLQQSLLSGNTGSGQGAALRIYGGSASILQSTFTRNTAGAQGGDAINFGGSSLIIKASTVAYNNGDTAVSLDRNGVVSISQSVFSHNGDDFFIRSTKADSASFLTIDSYTKISKLNFYNAEFVYGPSVDFIVLGDRGGPTKTLKPDPIQPGGNPAIGIVPIADCQALATVDQRGAPRPGILISALSGLKDKCDAGAYESGDPQLTVISPMPLNFGTVQKDNSLSLPVSIQNTGNDSLVISSASIAPLSANFALNSLNYPLILNAQNYFQDLNVLYTPTADQTDGANLSVIYNNPSVYPSVSATQVIPLVGTGAGFIVPPIQQIQDLLAVLNNPLQNNLFGVGKGNSAANKYNAFVNMIKSAGSLITNGKYPDACAQLLDASKKVDGKDNPPDFVSGTGAPAVYQSIVNLMSALYCPPQQ